jgi:hypothetical protein
LLKLRCGIADEINTLVVLPNQRLLLQLLNKQQVKLNYLEQKPQENVVENGNFQHLLVK